MNEPIPDKNHPVEQDSGRMLQQVTGAFHLPWPKKPLGKPKGQSKGSSRGQSKGTGRGRSMRGGKSKGPSLSYGFE
jgi:hypothetical protein